MCVSHQLILFEGLPGSGKSSLSQWLVGSYRRQGMSAKWFWEMNRHFGLDKWCRLEGEASGDWQEKCLEGWCNLLSDTAGDFPVLLDGALFNKSLLHLFAAGYPEEEIADLAEEMLRLAECRNPLVIYLQSPDAADHMLAVFETRGEVFEQSLSRWVEATNYAQSRNLIGSQGCLRFWQNYAGFVDRLFDRLQAAKFALDTHADCWPAYQERLALSLGLDYDGDVEEVSDPRPDLSGQYQLSLNDPQTDGRICELSVQFDRLMLRGLSVPLEEVSVLMPVAADQYEVRGQDTKLILEEAEDEPVFRIESSWGRLDGARLLKVA